MITPSHSVYWSAHLLDGNCEGIKGPGKAAKGLVALSAIDPDQYNPKWLAFSKEYVKRFHSEPQPYASYAYDGMTMLIAAIHEAGLNRGLLMDALPQYEMNPNQGASGSAFLDYTLKNIAPVTFAKVKNGHFVHCQSARRTGRVRRWRFCIKVSAPPLICSLGLWDTSPVHQ